MPATEGQTKSLSTAVEVGFSGAKLSFNKGVRILIPGQAGKRTGYVRTGIAFTEITNVCAADNQVTGDALVVDGDCKIDVGGDLVIWTKHFTKFAAYTQTTNNNNGGGNGGGGGGGGSSFVPPVVAQQGAVLGASTQRIVDGMIVKLVGKNQYYLIKNGRKVHISPSIFKKKYLNRTLIEVDKKTLKAISSKKK